MRIVLLLAALFVAAPAAAQDTYSTLNAPATGADVTAAVAAEASARASAMVTMAASIPTASTTVPPSVSDTGATGTTTTVYALANHTHASKARKGRVQVPASGTLAIVFPLAFSGTPVCSVTAEATAGDTNVVNAQIDGTPTTIGMTIRITRTQQSAVALIGLTILSVPTQVATWAHYLCLEP